MPAALASATYDAANQIATWGGTAFSYDLNGNLTSDGSTTYTWDARNQPVGLSGGVSASFQYDGVGRRRSKTLGDYLVSPDGNDRKGVTRLKGVTRHPATPLDLPPRH